MTPAVGDLVEVGPAAGVPDEPQPFTFRVMTVEPLDWPGRLRLAGWRPLGEVAGSERLDYEQLEVREAGLTLVAEQ